MEDSYINNSSVDESYNNSNIKYNETAIINGVLMYIIISIGLPLTLVAIYHLYSQVRNGQVAPIYIINLLISDLLQFCIMIIYVAEPKNYMTGEILNFFYRTGLMASVCFMMCVALERYLVIAWPLWYRFRRNIKTSVVICVVVWILLLVFHLVYYFAISFEFRLITYALIFLLPLPLFIFSLFGTIRALSAAISVPPDEKRRIVAILVLVLLIYTLLFLPTIIMLLVEENRNFTFLFVSNLLLRFSPLADLFLYIFSRKGAVDKILACVCRCRMNSDRDVSMNNVRNCVFCHP